MTTVFAYWPIRGVAQPYRFLLEYLEVPYEDKCYNSREEWFAEKEEFLKTDVLANLPYLKHGGKIIFESQAIGVYLIEKLNRTDLLGSTLDEKVLVQQARGVLNDLRQNGMKAFSLPKEEFQAKGKEIFRENTQPHLKKLDVLLHGKKFLCGDKVSLADFLLYEFSDLGRCFDETFFDKLPNLKQHHQNFREIPQIKAYIASAKFHERPFMPLAHSNWG